MNSDELADHAKALRKEGQFDEAVAASERAVQEDAQSANAHWQLALSLLDKNRLSDARIALQRVTELVPDFAVGWTTLGLTLQDLGETSGIKECFEKAVKIDPSEKTALESLAEIYRAEGDEINEKRTLQSLRAQRELTEIELNRLGILYHNNSEYYSAIECYQSAAAKSAEAYPYFNLGLVYSNPEVRQYADAIDHWRKALRRDAGHSKSQTEIERVLPYITKIQTGLGAHSSSLQQDQWYLNYVSPIALLGFDEKIGLGDLNSKAVNRARKALLHEIELEGGEISWVPGLKVNRSNAVAICSELENEQLLSYHYRIFRNAELRDFLERGEIKHFIVGENEYPKELLQLIESRASPFLQWLSPIFARQFNITFSKALATGELSIIQCLLSGRRFTLPEDRELCFENAHRSLNRELQALRDAASNSSKHKPSLEMLETAISSKSLEILGTLPVEFHSEQQEAATLIRAISVDTHNFHDDSELAQQILGRCHGLTRHSPSLRKKLEEDEKELERQIGERRSREVSLRYKDKDFRITHQNVSHDCKQINLEDLSTIRFGKMAVPFQGGSGVRHIFVVGNKKREEIQIVWDSKADDEASKKYWSNIVDAALSFIVPRVARAMRAELDSGKIISMGKLHLNRAGIEFPVRNWFSTRIELCPWERIQAEISGGIVTVADPTNAKAREEFSQQGVDNAVVLPWLTGDRK